MEYFTLTDLGKFIDERYAGTSRNKLQYLKDTGEIKPSFKTRGGISIWTTTDAELIRDHWKEFQR